MDRATLRMNYPDIALPFEEILSIPANAKKYRFVAYNYRISKRGISLERILEVLAENNLKLSLCEKKWFE